MMQYVAVQVLTKKEAIVADIIEEQGRRHGVHLEAVAPGIYANQYGRGAACAEHISELPGYVLVGFKKWENRIYHIIKQSSGVIRVLLGQHIAGGYSGIMSEEEINPSFLHEKVEVAVEVTEDHNGMAERVKKQIQKCREIVEQKKQKAVRWIAVPCHLVADLFDDTIPESASNEGGKAFRRIWERLSRFLRQNRRAM